MNESPEQCTEDEGAMMDTARDVIVFLIASVVFGVFSHDAFAQCDLLGNLLRGSPSVSGAENTTKAGARLESQKRSGTSQSDNVADDGVAAALSSIPRVRLEVLNTTVTALSKVARVRPNVVICASEEVNALATTYQGTQVVVLLTGLLDLLQYDRDAIAFVVSHELAHLVLGHTTPSGAEASSRLGDAAEAVRAGREYERTSGRRGAGVLMARQMFEGRLATYSRAREKDADDTGYQMMLAAGFDPAGALKAAKTMLVTFGNEPTGFFDRHPGWEERTARLEEVIKAEQASRERVAAADRRRDADQKLARVVDELIETRRWRAASAYVAKWLTDAPDSGTAWYYRGILLGNSSGTASSAIDAFERAFELDPSNLQANRKLCELLRRHRYLAESAHCARDLASHNFAEYEAFRERHWGNRLFVGGGGTQLPRRLWMTRDRSGTTFITNDQGLRNRPKQYDDEIPPERVPLRWQRR